MGLKRILPQGTKVYPVKGKGAADLWPCKAVKLNKNIHVHLRNESTLFWLQETGKDTVKFSKFNNSERWAFSPVESLHPTIGNKIIHRVHDPKDPQKIFVYGFIFQLKDVV